MRTVRPGGPAPRTRRGRAVQPASIRASRAGGPSHRVGRGSRLSAFSRASALSPSGIGDLGRIRLLERGRELVPPPGRSRGRGRRAGSEGFRRARRGGSARSLNDTPAGIGSDWGSATSQGSARPTSRIISALSIHPAPDCLTGASPMAVRRCVHTRSAGPGRPSHKSFAVTYAATIVAASMTNTLVAKHRCRSAPGTLCDIIQALHFCGTTL